jgi:copper ion binding protein
MLATTTFVEETTMATSTYTVSGMTCGHCVNAVTEEVSRLEGVTEVQVDLATGAVTVTSAAPLDDAAVAAAVDEAGYEVVA